MKKIYFGVLMALFLTTSCGYNIVGVTDQSSQNNQKICVNQIVNDYRESDYLQILKSSVTSFFDTYSQRSTKECYYNISVTLKKVTSSSSINSVTQQSVLTDLSADIKITAADLNGKTIYEKVFSSSSNYKNTNNISLNTASRNKAFESIVNDILLDFKYDIQRQK